MKAVNLNIILYSITECAENKKAPLNKNNDKTNSKIPPTLERESKGFEEKTKIPIQKIITEIVKNNSIALISVIEYVFKLIDRKRQILISNEVTKISRVYSTSVEQSAVFFFDLQLTLWYKYFIGFRHLKFKRSERR